MTHPDRWLKVRPAAPPPVTSAEAKPAVRVKAGPDPDYGVTRAGMEALAQRHVEIMQDRQRYADLNLRRALEAAPKLTGRE